ncbi:carbohydrate ABC transporter permease [Paenibacillus eucommiae]|uniref:Aldouronate transport system permease protein n=1 Tax=Paenibacillus eucommiae TaxID=1355755 RepID=A0ABS4IRN2_9BACL|nr:carbohydrate ABC transporter permease [Paenibacillus eucommiae]MBP1990234.1 putative aldouronate transport system permease protein [Paenibacillus eucommiae]
MQRYKRTFGDWAFDAINNILMIIILCAMIYPFLYIFNYSISNIAYVSGNPLLWPRGVNFEAYKVAFGDPDILRGLVISIARTVLGPALMIAVTTTAGYVISRQDLMWGKFIRKYFVFTMYFSGGIIPGYVLIKELHLTGTFLVYIIPSAAAVFNMILIKTFMEALPRELEESAVIDGANDFQLFVKIMFPLSLPVIAAVTLFASVSQWNAFFDTQLFNSMNPELFPLQYVLYNALQSVSSSSLPDIQTDAAMAMITPQTLKMAMTMITIIPILFVYPLLQKYFIKGLLIGSIKG